MENDLPENGLESKVKINRKVKLVLEEIVTSEKKYVKTLNAIVEVSHLKILCSTLTLERYMS